jgi:Predicted membrane protein (DUF2339)
MTSLVFLFAVAVIFGAVLAVEVRESDATAIRRPLGLIAWLTGGNWPAKIGGGLLVVGVGSLLRYALINFDVAPSLKLGVGVLAAAALGLAATLTRIGSAKRAVSLALGGAAFGVAYLTAYSAFALFHYVPSVTGIGLLALTAIGAGVYAVTRSALSLAMLAMVGAFLAPAFAVDNPGPTVVYGYYIAASLLTLVMVTARGWRPLIHLSFLFTLAGGVFFAWTSRYYSAEHANVMLPVLLALAAVHLTMPLAERRATRGVFIERLDLIYLLLLPAVAAFSAVIIAPSRISLSNELVALAAIWAIAASYLGLAKRDGFALHTILAALLLGLGVAARYRNLPWELLTLAFSVGSLWLAARRSTSARLHNALAGLVPITGMLHVASSLSPVPGSAVFANGRFVERLIGAALLILAGYICRTIRQSLDTLLISVGIGWALIAVGSELVRWDLVSVALVTHWVLLAVTIALALIATRSVAISNALVIVPLGVLITAAWAAISAPLGVSGASMVLAPLVLLMLAMRRAGPDSATHAGRLLAAVLSPLAAGIWATHVGSLISIEAPQFALSLAAGAALLVLVVGHYASRRSSDWYGTFAEMCAYAFAAALLGSTLLLIGRSPWAVALECLAFVGLLWTAFSTHDKVGRLPWLIPASAIGLALLLQTNLLRWLGPEGELHIWDVAHMRSPTLLSLLWAAMGGTLTVWGRRQLSRPLWIAGATLLVAAAVKLVLLDFSSLGQLTNIFAVIAAGVVFMLVGWLAPMPPAAKHTPQVPAPSTPEPTAIAVAVPPPMPRTQPTMPATNANGDDYFARNATSHTRTSTPDPADQSNKKIAWTIAIVAGLILPLAQCSHATRELIRRSFGFSSYVAPIPGEAAPAPAAVVEPEAPMAPTASTVPAALISM